VINNNHDQMGRRIKTFESRCIAWLSNEVGINSRDNEMMSSDISPAAIKALFTEC
jgi:hypothetical protein